MKRLPSWLPASAAFSSAVLAALLRFRPRPMRLTLDGETIAGRFLCLSVANGRYFGSGLGIAPQASVNDGLFELVLIRDGNGLDFLRLLPQLRAAQPLRDPRVRYLRGRQLQVDGAAADCPLELDGELCGSAPVTFELVPAALQCLMLPPG
ncbi:Diacylglycerol kinase [compost metagenome]